LRSAQSNGNAIDLIYYRSGDHFPSTSLLFRSVQVLHKRM